MQPPTITAHPTATYTEAPAAKEPTEALSYIADALTELMHADSRSTAFLANGEEAGTQIPTHLTKILRDRRLRDEPLPALITRDHLPGNAFALLGRHAGPIGIVTLSIPQHRCFAPQYLNAAREFLDEYGSVIMEHLLNAGTAARQRKSVPVSFVIDTNLRLVLSEESPDADSVLHALYRPRAGMPSHLLHGTLTDLIAELIAEPGRSHSHTATRSLPFAFARVTRLIGDVTPLFLVTIEPIRYRSHIARARETFNLSRRESEVLNEVLCGASSTSIGQTLSISHSTAAFHLTALFRKTGTHNRTELAGRVLGCG
jgi:DNA-binding CsgD family transcriptional regulator